MHCSNIDARNQVEPSFDTPQTNLINIKEYTYLADTCPITTQPKHRK